MYDYLVVGSGLFGSTFARMMKDHGRSVLVLEKEDHVGGMVYTKRYCNIDVHMCGGHIFHTKHRHVWEFVNKFASFNNYRHRAMANYNGKIISLPFNMMTYHQLFGCATPQEAKAELDRRKVPIKNPQNLEEWCLSQVGEEIYQTLIYHYTKKQWMREPRELPVSIIKRLPLRMTYNDLYFDDAYQGIPVDGYTKMVENMLDGIPVELSTNFNDIKNNWKKYGHTLVYSGAIDGFFDYCYGGLEYRTLAFQHRVEEGDFQGTSQVNYTGEQPMHTRVIEHKHFI
jgi:UDP-galactopyranose mutase